MATWIYFATAAKTSLASTVGLALSTQLLWRSARNANGALIANVGKIRPGDRIVVAWRHPGRRRTAYLRCRVAHPLAPPAAGLVIDRIAGADARSLIEAGYPAGSSGEVEGIRLDEIEECFFEVQGVYGGNNAIHVASPVDLEATNALTPIPPQELSEDRARSQSDETVRTSEPVLTSIALGPFEISPGTADRAFDAYLMVDWSANSRPTSGTDSIWIATGAWFDRGCAVNEPINARTRARGMAIVREHISGWKAEGRRVLVGFDFAFGYPAGFANALGLDTSEAPWKALHAHLATHVTDSPENEHNRDAFAEQCNIRRRRSVEAATENIGCPALELRLPRRDLIGVDVKLLGKLCQRPIALDGG